MKILHLRHHFGPGRRFGLGPMGLPLGVQLIALLVCALVAAQAVTLGLTVLFPPQPPVRWNLDDVAHALSGGPLSGGALSGGALSGRLERQTMAGPPDISGAGWLVSQSSREALADRLHRKPDDVVLAFYTQLPVGGVAMPPAHSPLSALDASAWQERLAFIPKARAGTGPGGPGGAGTMPGGGFPGGHFPGGGMPGGGFPGGMPGGHLPGTGGAPAGHPGGLPGGGTPHGGIGGSKAGGPPAAGGSPPQSPASLGAQASALGVRGALAPLALPQPLDLPMATVSPIALPSPVAEQSLSAEPAPLALPKHRGFPAQNSELAQSRAVLASQGPSAHPTDSPQPSFAASAAVKALPIPFRRPSASLFGAVLPLASPPFIEGDFIAAARQANGTWLAVAPAAEPFPNRWQRQVLVWFVLSLLIVSPLAWLFARRIVRPLEGFARAAETLGRDPSATILPLTGPAEIGRAAYAFNQMRYRLRAFVDDRTAMVGAISHDLRTPLTRLRFRVEDVPDAQRDGILKEVTEMEAMIAHVLAFIRDASTPGKRETVDFGVLLADTVKDAQMVGGRVEFEGIARLPVEVDPVGMRRLLDNLLENAVKYGEHARVRLSVRDGEALAEIIDDGPGIPEAEWDHVFEPFYRTESARKSGKPGSGLGLAVCRSIARAHGGDVVLSRGKEGFVASLSVPLVVGRRAA